MSTFVANEQKSCMFWTFYIWCRRFCFLLNTHKCFVGETKHMFICQTKHILQMASNYGYDEQENR